MQTADRILQQYLSMIKSAKFEILMILPTVNAIQREHNIGVIDELKMTVTRGVKIRLLSAEDEFIKEKLDQLRVSGIVIRRIETPTETKFKMLSVDKRYSLVVETKDDTKRDFSDAIGVAIFSNSNATVAPLVTIFETLWRETDLYEKTREAERVKDEFVNIAAHELRNPLMPILAGSESLSAAIETLKDKLPASEYEALHSDCSIITRNTLRLIELTEDILQVSRLEGRSFRLTMRDVDLEKMIKSVIASVKKKYSDKIDSVQIIYQRKDSGKKPLIVACDESKIEQCIHNLLDNAVKFTDRGEVRIDSMLLPDEVSLQIRDSGAGIDPQIVGRLFEKFATKSEGGTGLGLYVTKMIVLAHGGRISGVQNIDGPGATFAFSIPRNLSADTNPMNETVGPDPAVPSRSKTVQINRVHTKES